MPATVRPFPSREVCPPAHVRWQESRALSVQLVRTQAAEFLAEVEHYRTLFEKHVYGNPNATQFDYQQHRMCLAKLIFKGDQLAINLLQSPEANAETRSVALDITAQVEELAHTFCEYHAPVTAAMDLPASFQTACEELKNGQVVKFDL